MKDFSDEEQLVDAIWDGQVNLTGRWVGRRKGEEPDSTVFLYTCHANVEGKGPFTIVGFHADIPGGEWEVIDSFPDEAGGNSYIKQNWIVTGFSDHLPVR